MGVITLRLHQSAYEHAQKLIANRRCVLDRRGDWTDHKPARSAEKRFIEQHGLAAFGRWHLGEDDEEAEGSKRRYKFPFGDFESVHRCAVLAAETRAGQYKYGEIERAAAQLHAMLDALMGEKQSSGRQHVPSV